MMLRVLAILLWCGLLLFGTSCSEQETPQTAAPAKVSDKPTVVRQELQVVVPDDVKGQWQSVKIAVRDRQTGVEDIYSVDIGGSFRLPDADIKVTVESFLPAFIMDGQRVTSSSNRTTNPAALISIFRGEELIYHGWLFGLYPDTHAFQHPRYNFTLLGYKAAG